MLLELMRRQQRSPDGVRASSRDLANACKLARSKTVLAIDSLTARGLITTRQGTATQAATYRVNILDTVKMSGPLRGPLTAETWSPKGTTLVPLWDHPRPEEGPPPTENKGNSISAGSVDIRVLQNPILDRVLFSRPSRADPELLAYIRRWLHSYMAKLGVDDVGHPLQSPPHPPDDQLVAQVLAIGDPPQIMRALESLMLERKPVATYGYFVTVLLQRIHGISWQQTKAARAALRVVRAGKPPAPPEPQQLDLSAEISAIAANKAFR